MATNKIPEDKIKQVQDLAKDMGVVQACKKVGIAKTSYYASRKLYAKSQAEVDVVIHEIGDKPKRKYTRRENKSSGKAVVIVTDISSLRDVLEKL